GNACRSFGTAATHCVFGCLDAQHEGVVALRQLRERAAEQRVERAGTLRKCSGFRLRNPRRPELGEGIGRDPVAVAYTGEVDQAVSHSPGHWPGGRAHLDGAVVNDAVLTHLRSLLAPVAVLT